MQHIEANTYLKHPNKKIVTIFSKYYEIIHKVCFPIGKFVSMSLISELMTKVCAILVKLMILQNKRLELTSQFDVSKLQKQLRSVKQTHLYRSANSGPLP